MIQLDLIFSYLLTFFLSFSLYFFLSFFLSFTSFPFVSIPSILFYTFLFFLYLSFSFSFLSFLSFSYSYAILCDNTPKPTPTIPTSLNHSWPLDRLLFFSSPARGISHSLRTHETRHTQPSGWKKRRTIMDLGQLQAQEGRRVLEFCAALRVSADHHERVFARNSPKATRNADSSSCVGQRGILTGSSSHLSLSSASTDFCRLPYFVNLVSSQP